MSGYVLDASVAVTALSEPGSPAAYAGGCHRQAARRTL